MNAWARFWRNTNNMPSMALEGWPQRLCAVRIHPKGRPNSIPKGAFPLFCTRRRSILTVERPGSIQFATRGFRSMNHLRFTELATRERCPSCGSPDASPLLRHLYEATPLREFLVATYEGRADLSRLTGIAFEVDRCNSCRLVFQRTVPVGSLLDDLYDVWIAPGEKERLRGRYELSYYRYLAEQVDFLVQHFRKKPSQVSVLDFGLGWSEWASVAKGYGCNVAGMEISSERIRHARSLGIEIVEWGEVPQRAFDYINAEQVFEHLINPRETLVHLAKGLRANGLIGISVPNGRGIEKRLKRLPGMRKVTMDYIMPITPLEHVNCFDHWSLVELGLQSGLRPVRPQFRLLYNAASGWLEPKQSIKNLIRPLYRHLYPKSTVVYFTHSGAQATLSAGLS
jgi:2-polyprenyl-3-methyl-5-hydroxy-6-metoxy-1,4-benzoquinol methylase